MYTDKRVQTAEMRKSAARKYCIAVLQVQGFCLILAFFDTLIISRISLNSLHCKDFLIIQQTLCKNSQRVVPLGIYKIYVIILMEED